MIGPARPQTDAGSVVEPQPAPFRLLLWDLQPLPPPDALDPLGVGGGFHDVPSAGAVSSSLTNSKRRASAAEAARSSNSGS